MCQFCFQPNPSVETRKLVLPPTRIMANNNSSSQGCWQEVSEDSGMDIGEDSAASRKGWCWDYVKKQQASGGAITVSLIPVLTTYSWPTTSRRSRIRLQRSRLQVEPEAAQGPVHWEPQASPLDEAQLCAHGSSTEGKPGLQEPTARTQCRRRGEGGECLWFQSPG